MIHLVIVILIVIICKTIGHFMQYSFFLILYSSRHFWLFFGWIWVKWFTLDSLSPHVLEEHLCMTALGLPPVPDFPGCPRYVPCCPTSRQDQPRDAKCPWFQGKVKVTKIITVHSALLTYLVTYLIVHPSHVTYQYQVRWSTNYCHQIALKCTKSHIV